MKKLLCVLMTVAMLVSSVAVMGVSAAEGYAYKNTITDSFSSYEEFAQENADKSIFGYTYDFLYESTARVDWGKLDINIGGLTGKPTRNSFSLAYSDMSLYLERLMTNLYTGGKLFTEEYATDLVNFIGKLVYPNFVEKQVDFGTNEYPNEDEFYEIVVLESNLDDIIRNNWCYNGVNFKPFLTAFGVNVEDIIESDFARGKPIAKALVKGAVNSILAYGPLEFIVRLLDSFSKNYTTSYYEATTALFSEKINNGKPGGGGYSVEELESIEGLLTYVFDGVIDYKFFTFPKERMAKAGNDENPEKLLYLLMYFSINYKYNYDNGDVNVNNADIINGLAQKVRSYLTENNRHGTGGYSMNAINTVADRISVFIDVIFKGEISDEAVNLIHSLTMENVDEMPNDIFTQFKNWLSGILKKIADYFDYVLKVLTGEIKYGESVINPD